MVLLAIIGDVFDIHTINVITLDPLYKERVSKQIEQCGRAKKCQYDSF